MTELFEEIIREIYDDGKEETANHLIRRVKERDGDVPLIFTKMAEQYHVEQVIYAHCHGEERFHDSIRGRKKGILYSLASGDCLRWKPLKVLN